MYTVRTSHIHHKAITIYLCSLLKNFFHIFEKTNERILTVGGSWVAKMRVLG